MDVDDEDGDDDDDNFCFENTRSDPFEMLLIAQIRRTFYYRF